MQKKGPYIRVRWCCRSNIVSSQDAGYLPYWNIRKKYSKHSHHACKKCGVFDTAPEQPQIHTNPIGAPIKHRRHRPRGLIWLLSFSLLWRRYKTRTLKATWALLLGDSCSRRRRRHRHFGWMTHIAIWRARDKNALAHLSHRSAGQHDDYAICYIHICIVLFAFLRSNFSGPEHI